MGKETEPKTGMSWSPKDFEEETRLPTLDGLPKTGQSQASGFYFPAALFSSSPSQHYIVQQ